MGVVLEQSAGVRHRHPMIAMPALPIGWSAGLWQRRHGVASMEARAVQEQQLAVSKRCSRRSTLRFACVVAIQGLRPDDHLALMLQHHLPVLGGSGNKLFEACRQTPLSAAILKKRNISKSMLGVSGNKLFEASRTTHA